jgi:hypothetical protein
MATSPARVRGVTDERRRGMDKTTGRIRALLHEAGETHHIVYRITDGDDPDWASWYADWLIAHSELPDLLGGAPIRSHLVAELVALERDVGAGEGWEDGYAARLFERFRVAA